MKTIILLLAIISICQAQVSFNYDIYQAQDGGCVQIAQESCVKCTNSTGHVNSYIVNSDKYTGHVSAYRFSDENCYYSRENISVNLDTCDPSYACEITYSESLDVLTLTVSSDSALDASFFTNEDAIRAVLSSNKITVHGYVKGVQIKSSNGDAIRVEAILSPTQYSTNIGIFEFGESYESNSLSFQVTKSSYDSFPVPNQIPSNLVNFHPFVNARVINENEYYLLVTPKFTFDFFTDNVVDLSGLELSNPYFSITDMTFFPVYDSGDYGHLVFQFEDESSFYTKQCYYEYSNINIYQCEFSTGGSFDSFTSSVHENVESDKMAFQLF